MAEGETVFTFKANTKPAEEATDSFFSGLTNSFTEINSGLELINKSIYAITKASQAMVDFAKTGEEIAAIGTRFELIAKQAGLVPEALASEIERAVGGTVDMEDALKAATGAIVSLEAGANRLPELFEIAKKSAALFGGDAIERFEQLNLAIASGTTRSLKQIGIIINAESVFKNYAKGLDITADKLTIAEKQQALLNAVIDKGSESFKNINTSLTPIAENLKRQSVALKELGDTGATAFNRLFGDVIAAKISQFTKFLEVLNIKLGEVLIDKAPTAAENLKLLTNSLDQLQASFAMVAVRGDVGRLEEIQKQIDATKEQVVVAQQLLSIEQFKQSQINASTATTNAATDATNRLTESQKRLEDQLRNKFMAAAKLSIDAQKAMEQQSRQLGTTFSNSLTQVIVRGIDHIAQKIIKGEDIFGGLLAVILNTFGDMAIQLGTMFIGIGIAVDALKSLTGFAAIAAGVGLIAVGSIMKALAGGGGAVNAPNPNAAAADAVIASGDIYQEQTKEEERVKQQTGVQVVVQGNIFDSRETGLQIAQIINDSFDLNGTIIRANA
jgi:hypothetical protein